MANSYAEYTSLSGTTYTTPSNFLSIQDIFVKGYNGSAWTTLTISQRSASAKTVTLSSAPSSFQKIRVYRMTSSNPLVDFQNGSTLTATDLDTSYQQGLLLSQEVAEDADPDGASGIGNIVSSQLQLPLTNFSSTGIDDNATSTAITIDSSERVGIGTSSPDNPLDIAYTKNVAYSVDNFTNADNAGLRIENTSTTANAMSLMQFRCGSGADLFFGIEQKSANDGDFIFANQNSPDIEMARISSDGRLKVGTTADADVVTPTANIVTNASFGVNDGSNKVQLKSDRISFNANNFFVLNASAAGVRLINGGTSWITQSDETLKENIVELSDVLDKVTNIRCVRYNLKNQNSDNVKIGFIAQDWQTNFGEVVEPDEDNKLGISYTETIPVLLKAIQELKTELNNAKARITALENA